MKIYQIHDTFGEWDGYNDYIVGTYLRKEKAEEELEKFRANERELVKQAMECAACPLADWLTLTEFKDYEKDGLNTCPRFKKFVDDRDGEVTCRNTYNHWDEHEYEIKEVEVIE